MTAFCLLSSQLIAHKRSNTRVRNQSYCTPLQQQKVCIKTMLIIGRYNRIFWFGMHNNSISALFNICASVILICRWIVIYDCIGTALMLVSLKQHKSFGPSAVCETADGGVCVNVALEMLCCMSWGVGRLMDGGCISCTFLCCLQLYLAVCSRMS